MRKFDKINVIIKKVKAYISLPLTVARSTKHYIMYIFK